MPNAALECNSVELLNYPKTRYPVQFAETGPKSPHGRAGGRL